MKISQKKGGDDIRIKEAKKALNLSSHQIAEKFDLCRASYYKKMNGTEEWKLSELITAMKMVEQCGADELEIDVNNVTYTIKIVSKFR